MDNTTTLVLNGRSIVITPKMLDKVRAARIRNAIHDRQVEHDLRSSGVLPRLYANSIGRSMPVVPTASPAPSVELNTRLVWQADRQKAKAEAVTPEAMEAKWQRFLKSQLVHS